MSKRWHYQHKPSEIEKETIQEEDGEYDEEESDEEQNEDSIK